jgi:hypothetical protein
MLNSVPSQGKVNQDLNAFSTSGNAHAEHHQADAADSENDLILNDNEILDAEPLEDVDNNLLKQYVPLPTRNLSVS